MYDLQSVEIAFKQDSSLTWEDIDKLCAASDDKRYSFRHHVETSQIKEVLFRRTKAEMDAELVDEYDGGKQLTPMPNN